LSNFDLLGDDTRAYRQTRLVSPINTCGCRPSDTGAQRRRPISACGAVL